MEGELLTNYVAFGILTSRFQDQQFGGVEVRHLDKFLPT